MNYNSILDPFFASNWISLGTLLGLLIIGLIFRKPLYVNRKPKFLFGALYFILFMIGFFIITMFNPMYWGYGGQDGVTSVTAHNGKLFVLDYQMAGGSEGTDPDPYHRIHVIDEKTGTKLFRFIAGMYAEIILVTDESIVCRNSSELNFYSVKDGELLAKWNTETLQELFPELKSGIDHFDPGIHRDGIPIVEVTAIDGKKYQLDLRSRQIAGEKPVSPTEARAAWKVENDHLEKDGKYLITLKGKEWADKRKQIYISSDSLLNSTDFFLEGKFIAISSTDSACVILHYENTTLANWILSGVSLNGKRKIWDIRQAEINSEKSEKPIETCWTTDSKSGVLYFVSSDEIIAVQMRDGKKIWQTKL